MPARARPWVAIQGVADRLTPTLRRQFLAAVQALQATVTYEMLARAVSAGELTAELSAALATLPRSLRPAVKTLTRVMTAAAAVEAKRLPASPRRPGLRIDGSFTLVNPAALDAAARGSLLVREITAETRRAVQAVIRRSIADGIPPRQAARLIRPLVGLTQRQALAVMNRQSALVARGVSLEKAQAAAERYAAKLWRERALTIARTETIGASADGQLALWRQARGRGLLPSTVMKRWTVTPDDRLCDLCAPMDGIEVPLDSLFPGGVDGPTLHPRCRCVLVISSASLAGRRRTAA